MREGDVGVAEVLARLGTLHGVDLLARAAEFLSETTGRSEVWLASDLLTSNWQPEDERWSAARASLAALPQKPAIRVLSLTGPAAPNTAIRILGSRRSGDEMLFDLEILRAADARGSATLARLEPDAVQQACNLNGNAPPEPVAKALEAEQMAAISSSAWKVVMPYSFSRLRW